MFAWCLLLLLLEREKGRGKMGFYNGLGGSGMKGELEWIGEGREEVIMRG